jgi:hypothetical protein
MRVFRAWRKHYCQNGDYEQARVEQAFVVPETTEELYRLTRPFKWRLIGACSCTTNFSDSNINFDDVEMMANIIKIEECARDEVEMLALFARSRHNNRAFYDEATWVEHDDEFILNRRVTYVDIIADVIGNDDDDRDDIIVRSAT